jgi:hypothetical protein
MFKQKMGIYEIIQKLLNVDTVTCGGVCVMNNYSSRLDDRIY